MHVCMYVCMTVYLYDSCIDMCMYECMPPIVCVSGCVCVMLLALRSACDRYVCMDVNVFVGVLFKYVCICVRIDD